VNFPFPINLSVVRIRAVLTGPAAFHTASLILDTGASHSVINPALLGFIGCSPNQQSPYITITSATDAVRTPVVRIPRFECLGIVLVDFPVVAHAIPAPPAFVGLLGIDFLRGREITINFRRGVIKLN